MKKRTPDFENNLLKVLKGEVPDRATLYEMILTDDMYAHFAGHKGYGDSMLDQLRFRVEAMSNAGYDFATSYASSVSFLSGKKCLETVSLNGVPQIEDWETFEKYKWPDMDSFDTSHVEKIEKYLPEGMKICIMGPGGVLENAIEILGYDNLCILLYDEPELVKAVFDEIGARLFRYYEMIIEAPSVGFICYNDDWGFNTQTFLRPDDLRKYVFPWCKKIVDLAHSHGKPCMIHSCGYFDTIIDDIIDDMHFDARHSYEDNITPVEKAYEDFNGRIAVLGGIDVNFMCSKTPDEVYKRAYEMLERTKTRGGYALGTGNSITKYIPKENCLAMIRAAHEFN